MNRRTLTHFTPRFGIADEDFIYAQRTLQIRYRLKGQRYDRIANIKITDEMRQDIPGNVISATIWKEFKNTLNIYR